MKILVTGASGFIGSHTAERLKDLGHEVIGVDNFSAYYSVDLKKLNKMALAAKGIEILKKDLRDTDLIECLPKDLDYIFHYAAQPGLSKDSTYADYYENNFLVTKNLVEYAMQLPNLKMFVNIATSSIYGLDAIFSEDKTPNPASDYGQTKLQAENLVLEKCAASSTFNACSLRLYSVFGPRERPEKMYAKLIKCAFEGTQFPLYDGSEKHLRSFTFVGDIVDGVVSVIGKEDKVNGEIINLGTEIEHTTLEGILAVQTVIGKKIRIDHVEARAGDQNRTKANIEKAKRLLNYKPETTLVQGVQAQVDWYIENFIEE